MKNFNDNNNNETLDSEARVTGWEDVMDYVPEATTPRKTEETPPATPDTTPPTTPDIPPSDSALNQTPEPLPDMPNLGSNQIPDLSVNQRQF